MNKLKYVAYYRVAASERGNNSVEIQEQQEAVANLIKERKGKLVAEFREVESGRMYQRPELDKAILRCQKADATLIIAKLDRLGRNSVFATSLQESKIKFVCADIPEVNEQTIHTIAALARYERKRTSVNTKQALARAKRRGTVLGNPNLDEVRNTDTTYARARMMANAQERNNQIAEAIAQYEVEEGKDLSGRELADRLNEAGYTTTRGHSFSHTQALRIKAATSESAKRRKKS